MTEPDVVDDEAPFGRRPDGTPYKRSQEDRDRLAAQLAAGRARAKKAPSTTGRASSGPGARPKANTVKSPHDTYYDAGMMLAQIPMLAFGLLGKATGNPTFSLDALTVKVHAPNVANAVADMALEDHALAAVLDNIGKASPYAGLVMATLPLLGQLAANHGLLAPTPEMDILSPIELMRKAGLDVPDDDPEDAQGPTAPASDQHVQTL